MARTHHVEVLLDLACGLLTMLPAKLAVRPSRLALHPAGAPNTLPGRLDKVTYVGSHLEFVISTDFGNVFVVSTDVDASFAAGEVIGLGFAAHGPVLIRN